MANLHVSLNAMRSDAFALPPENLTLVTDSDHPLYDPRVLDEPDEAMVRNIMVYGVIEPIIIRKNGDKVEVVAGRSRVKCALEANRRLTAEGKQPSRVPAMLKRGQDADMYGVLISENECRREDDPLRKAEKAQRLINMGKSVEEVAIAFGVKRQSVETWLQLGDVAPPVLDAVEQGEISATAAAQLSKLERTEQVEKFEEMKAEGGKVTVERARRAARGDRRPGKDAPSTPPTLPTKSRQQIEAELRFWSEQEIEINVEFYEGVKNALRWVLGLSAIWPARKEYPSSVAGDTPESPDNEKSCDTCRHYHENSCLFVGIDPCIDDLGFPKWGAKADPESLQAEPESAETKKGCDTCKHSPGHGDKEPCRECDAEFSKRRGWWEPEAKSEAV
jgi:ParB family chromosome partitioning protein